MLGRAALSESQWKTQMETQSTDYVICTAVNISKSSLLSNDFKMEVNLFSLSSIYNYLLRILLSID